MKEMAILDAAKARAIYESGYTSVWHISKAKPVAIMKVVLMNLWGYIWHLSQSMLFMK